MFDVSTRESLSKFHNTVKPMALRWSPVGNALAMIDADGRFAIIDNPIPAHMAPPFGSAPAPVTAAASKPAPAAPKSAAGAAAGTTAAPAAANTSASGAGESSDDEVGDAPVVRRRATTRRLRAAGSTGGADSVAAVKARLGLLQDSDEEFDESKAFLEAQAELERAAREREGRSAEAVTVQHVPVVTARHPVVQPGATPEGLKRRFLAWNAVGSITTRDEATYSSIEVEFSDSSANRPVRFTDHYGFAIAAMCTCALLLLLLLLVVVVVLSPRRCVAHVLPVARSTQRSGVRQQIRGCHRGRGRDSSCGGERGCWRGRGWRTQAASRGRHCQHHLLQALPRLGAQERVGGAAALWRER